MVAVAEYPGLIFLLLKDEEKASEYDELTIQHLEKIRSDRLKSSINDRFRAQFALVLHAIVTRDNDLAAERLEQIRSSGSHDAVVGFQIDYVAAVCQGRCNMADRKEARLLSAIDKLETVRSKMRLRTLTRVLGPVRQLLYEHYAKVLHDANRSQELGDLFVRYKRPSMVPASLNTLKEKPAAWSALLEDIICVYETLQQTRQGQGASVEDDLATIVSDIWNLLAKDWLEGQKPAVPGTRPNTNVIIQEALDSISNTVFGEMQDIGAPGNQGRLCPQVPGNGPAYFLFCWPERDCSS